MTEHIHWAPFIAQYRITNGWEKPLHSNCDECGMPMVRVSVYGAGINITHDVPLITLIEWP